MIVTFLHSFHDFNQIYDLELSDGTMALQQGLLVEKCRFLESSGCVQTCLHACKVPTQRFFLEEMGLPVTLRPNMTDLRYICLISLTSFILLFPRSSH